MKVLFITNWYPTHDFSYGGVFVREHARAVAAAGNEVVVLHLARASKECRGLWKMEEELDPELREGIPAYHVFHRMLRLRGASYPLYLYSAIKAFRRLRVGLRCWPAFALPALSRARRRKRRGRTRKSA